MSETINITELVEKYIALRDRKAQITNDAKKQCATLDTAMEKAEAAMLAFFNANGLDSAGCANGTVYKQTRTSVTVADWDAVVAFVKENDAFHMLEHRVSKTAVEEYVSANEDLPPGINWKADTVINVRRS